MRLLKRLLDKFGRTFMPRRFAPVIHGYLLKAGIHKVPYVLFGSLFYVTAAITALLYIFLIYPAIANLTFWKLSIYTFIYWTALQVVVAGIIILIIYFYLDLRIFKRTIAIEEMLPEFLQQVSSNLKGGMTFENAMWHTINPRFKILAVETSEMMKKVMTGTSTTDVLIHLSRKYNSPMLKRTLELIVSELESGGNISAMIDKMVKDLDRMRQLKNEMTASVIGYMIMISTIVIVIAPLLFALSFHLMALITGLMRSLAPSLQTNIIPNAPIKLSASGISSADFRLFSIISIATISFIASFIVSIIEKGTIKSGIKYIPIYVGSSIGFYFLFLAVISNVFKFV